MAWVFGDGFDLYAATADAVAGYWDSGNPANFTLQSGRFGGQAVQNITSSNVYFTKASNINDAVHHIVVAFRQTAALSGTTLGLYFQLVDVATNQCCIVFRSDGAILLTSATPAGTVLATYTGAVTAQNTWFGFEFEVIINNTTGRFRARKNGNASDDFDSGAVLNTRPGANAYANKLTIGTNATVNNTQIDDLLWRSDASSVAWAGDIRCYTRMPASDASVQFSRSPTNYFAQTTGNVASTAVSAANTIRATSVTAPTTGTLVSLSFNVGAAYTGHVKMALYDNTGASGGPGALLASSVELTNPAAGVTAFSVTGGPTVTKGTIYWVAVWSDAGMSGTGGASQSIDSLSLTYTTSFPSTMAGFSNTSANGLGSNGMNVSPTNAALVNETQQDGTTSYVYDSTVGHADFYNIGSIASTPLATIMVTTRAFMQKSDAGTRTASVQLKSVSTTTSPAALVLSTSWGWAWQSYLNDPGTGLPWTATGVNNAQIGPTTVA
jgi:hypothetical protein